MGLINCPSCHRDSFTWSYDEERTPPTSWYCISCGYSAAENESLERHCPACLEKSLIRLEDDTSTYWYCHRCSGINLIVNQ
ncbi:hypothetical protein [Chitinophaga sp. CB10]|uniref:hypothetical protein n=1 Tax=Chitinophaga sp. CB10 TaxID=1891659 RepID=UPI0025B9EB2B|nr:hypothetical protein [Chitinophaga sp. CB10]